jgi:hypothetical protein
MQLFKEMIRTKTPPPNIGRARQIKAAVTAMILTGSIAVTLNVLAHDGNGDGHDEELESIPGGVSTLLPDDAKNPVLHGWVGPLLPMHTMSVHNTLTWKKNSKMPLMLMFHRHSGYTADEVVNPDVIDFLIANRNPTTTAVSNNGAWSVAGVNAFGDKNNQFNSSFRRSFQQFAYGGYNIIHDVSQSVPTRIGVDQTVELCQVWDMNHPKAFEYDFADPPFSAAVLNNRDAELNFPAFRGTGPSKGLYYDMYCPGFSTLTDGRPVFMGGHDLNSQNGSYRVQIFDPETETWAARPASCMRKYFGKSAEAAAFRVANGLLADDFYLEKFYRAKMAEIKAATPTLTDAEVRTAMTAVYLPGCDPHALSPDDYSPTYEGIRLAGPNGTVTHPGKLTSDMKYARWYPTQITLPTNQIFIIAGWDRDESKYPQPATISSSTMALQTYMDKNAAAPGTYAIPPNADLAGFLKSGGDTDFLNSRVKQVVPEVYDARTDTTIALENAPIFQNAWYPNGLVIQTGPKRDDWKVACNDADLLGNVPSVLSTTKFDPVTGLGLPVGAHKPANSVQNRNFHNTWVLDVQKALKDPARGTPPPDVINQTSSQYWSFLSDAPSSHSEFTGNANIIELDKLGRVISHKLTHVGGQYPVSTSPLAQASVVGATTLTTTAPLVAKGPYNLDTNITNGAQNLEVVTVIAISGNTVTLAQPTTKAHAAGAAFTIFGTSKNVEEIDFASLSKVLKKGEVAVTPKWEVKGELYQPGRQNYCTPLPDGTVMILGGNGGTLPGIERWSLHLQMYDPKKPYDPANPATTNSVRKMAKSLIPRDEHGIIQLMPDATVYLGGQNRNGLVQAGDPAAPLGDADLGVPAGQLYRPPYLFDYRGAPASRPVIAQTTAVIDYGRPFTIKPYSLKPIKAVSMIRSGSMSHSVNTDVRLVKLAFKQAKNGAITVYPPKLPATAIGGYYQLFIVDEAGVPSEGVKVALGPDISKRVGKPASKYALTSATPTAQ